MRKSIHILEIIILTFFLSVTVNAQEESFSKEVEDVLDKNGIVRI